METPSKALSIVGLALFLFGPWWLFLSVLALDLFVWFVWCSED